MTHIEISFYTYLVNLVFVFFVTCLVVRVVKSRFKIRYLRQVVDAVILSLPCYLLIELTISLLPVTVLIACKFIHLKEKESYRDGWGNSVLFSTSLRHVRGLLVLRRIQTTLCAMATPLLAYASFGETMLSAVLILVSIIYLVDSLILFSIKDKDYLKKLDI